MITTNLKTFLKWHIKTATCKRNNNPLLYSISCSVGARILEDQSSVTLNAGLPLRFLFRAFLALLKQCPRGTTRMSTLYVLDISIANIMYTSFIPNYLLHADGYDQKPSSMASPYTGVLTDFPEKISGSKPIIQKCPVYNRTTSFTMHLDLSTSCVLWNRKHERDYTIIARKWWDGMFPRGPFTNVV